MKDILNDTKKRIGKKKFFNWHIYENNCRLFIKEILITLEKLDKETEKFMWADMNSLYIFPKEKMNILTMVVNLVNLVNLLC